MNVFLTGLVGFTAFALIICTIGLVLNIIAENKSMVILMAVCVVLNLINIGFQLIVMK